MSSATSRDEGGFALVSALWAVVLLAIVTGAIFSSGIMQARLAQAHRRQTEFAAVADAAIYDAIWKLLHREPGDLIRLDGTLQAGPVLGHQTTMRIQDEGGKIDINAAPEPAIQRLFTFTGMDSDAAEKLAQRVVAWRGGAPDDGVHVGFPAVLRGAEAGYRPRNGPIESIDELMMVPGVSASMLAKIRGLITLYSQSGMVDRSVASRLVLEALLFPDEDQVQAILKDRAGAADGQQSLGGATRPPAVVSLTGHAFTLTATVARDGFEVSRTAIIRLTGHQTEPIWVYEWR